MNKATCWPVAAILAATPIAMAATIAMAPISYADEGDEAGTSDTSSASDSDASESDTSASDTEDDAPADDEETVEPEDDGTDSDAEESDPEESDPAESDAEEAAEPPETDEGAVDEDDSEPAVDRTEDPDEVTPAVEAPSEQSSSSSHHDTDPATDPVASAYAADVTSSRFEDVDLPAEPVPTQTTTEIEPVMMTMSAPVTSATSETTLSTADQTVEPIHDLVTATERVVTVTVRLIATVLLPFVSWVPEDIPFSEAPALAVLGWVRRELESVAYDLTPTPPAGPTAKANELVQDSTGVVYGVINASGEDGAELTYTVVEAPTDGTVILDENGSWVYTPSDELLAAGGDDSFDVEVSYYGSPLLKALGRASTTTVTVPVTVTADSEPGDPTFTYHILNASMDDYAVVYSGSSDPGTAYNNASTDGLTTYGTGGTINISFEAGTNTTNHYVVVRSTEDDTYYNIKFTYDDQEGSRTAWSSCSAGGSSGATCSPTSKSETMTVTLLDAPGTVKYVPASELAYQNSILENLCDSSSDCEWTAETRSDYLDVGIMPTGFAPVYNGGTINSSTSHSETTTVATAYSWSVGSKQTLVAGFAKEEIQQTFGQTVSDSTSYSQTVTLSVAPDEYGYIYYQAPMYQYTGDWNVVYGNTTYVLEDSSVYTSNDDGIGRWVTSNSATPPEAEANGIVSAPEPETDITGTPLAPGQLVAVRTRELFADVTAVLIRPFEALGQVFSGAAATADPRQIMQDSENVYGVVNVADDAGPVHYEVITQPSGGTVVVDKDGTWVYTPDAALLASGGDDEFTIEISNNGLPLLRALGLTRSSTVTVPVTVVASTPSDDPTSGTWGTLVIYNYTSQDVTYYTNYYPDDPNGAVANSVLHTGDSISIPLAEQPMDTTQYFYPMFMTADGTEMYVISVTNSTNNTYNEYEVFYSCAASGSSGGTCSPSSQAGLAGKGATVKAVLMDAPGTEVTVPASDPDEQNELLDLCDNSGVTCTWTPTGQYPYLAEGELPEGFNPVWNDTDLATSTTYTQTASSSTTDSWTVSSTTSVELAKIYTAAIVATYGESTTDTASYSQSVNQGIAPGETGYIWFQAPMNAYEGYWTVELGNTTYTLDDTWVYATNPDGAGLWDLSNSSTPPASTLASTD